MRCVWLAVVLAASLATACQSSSAPGLPATGSTGGATGHTATRRHHHHHNHQPRRHSTGRGVPSGDLPRHALTPGVALGVGVAQICRPGYAASVRSVPEAEKLTVYARYGVADVPFAHEVDHLVSLELGGSNALSNLWPEPYRGRWGARTKDTLENRLHDLVCAGQIPLRRAQRIEAGNWVAAYRRYVGTPAGRSATTTAPVDYGGFYASSYGTARTIYCADDPAWHLLSRRYLVHARTWAALHRRFPGYHLHQPC